MDLRVALLNKGSNSQFVSKYILAKFEPGFKDSRRQHPPTMGTHKTVTGKMTVRSSADLAKVPHQVKIAVQYDIKVRPRLAGGSVSEAKILEMATAYDKPFFIRAVSTQTENEIHYVFLFKSDEEAAMFSLKYR